MKVPEEARENANLVLNLMNMHYIAVCDEQSQTAFLISENKKGVVR